MTNADIITKDEGEFVFVFTMTDRARDWFPTYATGEDFVSEDRWAVSHARADEIAAAAVADGVSIHHT